MTTTLERPPIEVRADRGDGGIAARRAVVRWAWRLFRREWRQQLLVLALVTVAVAATVVGAGVAINTPPPANAGFGTAHYMATLPGTDPHLATTLSALRRDVGRTDVIENQTIAVPGSIDTFNLRAQDPHGPFGTPMLDLVSGHYPTGPDQVALTAGVASELHLSIGDLWRHDGTARRVVGIVENPQSLLDEFALVPPGQVHAPTQVTVLFNAGKRTAHSLGHSLGIGLTTPTTGYKNVLNPETIVLALATLGMLLIGLVAIGGFTVLAQRRLRSIGMLGALGATDRNIRLVVRANGAVVGVVGAVLGLALGFVAWLAYRPHLEASAHHLVGAASLPWVVVLPAMTLAVLASFVAASRPARAVARIPIVTALAGRPAQPKGTHRSAVPGVITLVIAFALVTFAASSNSPGALVLGLVALTVAVILLAPMFLTTLARLGRRTPVAMRLALRDLARYRARSSSALGAISIGVLIAVLICVIANARYSNVLDWAGPNMSSNQLIVYSSNSGDGGGPKAGPSAGPTPAHVNAQHAVATHIANALGSNDIVALDGTSASLTRNAPGRNFSGQIYVATPQLLRAFGINPSSLDPHADILTMRPGLAGTSKMELTYSPSGAGTSPAPSGPNGPSGYQSGVLSNPDIETVPHLPSGTSAPNTVITEHAVHQLGLESQIITTGWLIQASQPLTAAQIDAAQHSAAAAGMTVESKNDAPTSAEVLNWATAFGVLLALGILAMTVGLIRSETASDIRTLAATGASSRARRTITAVTAGALALLGAVLGTVAAYVAAVAFFRSSPDGQGVSSLTSLPLKNLLVVLIGMPVVAAAGGWLLSGRQPATLGQQPLE